MSGNTQDVPCKGSRFNNVITSTVIYIGQPNDAQPAKCPKTCAQRGSWANPARSTTEGLALALQYFQYNPTTLSFGFGDFDVGAGDITVPANISFVGSGNNGSGTNLKARSYTWVDVPPPNTPTQKNKPIYYPAIYNAAMNSSVSVTSSSADNASVSVTSSAKIKMTIDTATIDPSNLLQTTDASTPSALIVQATGNAKVSVNINNTTVTQTIPGATAMSTVVGDSAGVSINMNGSNIQATSGTISNVETSGTGSLDWTDANSNFQDLGTTPSTVSAFITTAKDNSSVKFTSTGSLSTINVGADAPGFLYTLSDSATLAKIEGSTGITNLGPGQLIQHDFADGSNYTSQTLAKNVALKAGPWYTLATKPNFTGNINIADTNLVAKYSGEIPLTGSFAQTIVTGGTYTANDSGGSQDFATTATSHSFTNSGAIANITSGNLKVSNSAGGVYSANTTTAIAKTDITAANSAVTGTGTNAVALTNSGTLTVNSNANSYTLVPTEITQAGDVETEGGAQCNCSVFAAIFCSCTASEMSSSSVEPLIDATPSTNISSANDIFTGGEGISTAFSVSGTGGSAISSKINGATMTNVETAVQSNLNGTAAHTFTDVGSVYNNVGQVYNFNATEDASYTVGAATVIPQSLSTALASFTSTASAPSSATMDGAAYADDAASPLTDSFLTANGNVNFSATNLQADLQNSSFYTGDHTNGTSAALSAVRATQTGQPPASAQTSSTPSKMVKLSSPDGTGSASISNSALESANGTVLGADGLTNLTTTLSTLTTRNGTEQPLISADNISGLVNLLSTKASNASGDIVATATAVKTEWQAVASTVPPLKSLYNNTAPVKGLFQYAQSNGFIGSNKIKNADSSPISNEPATV